MLMICTLKDDDIIQQAEIKKYQFGQTKVEVHVPQMTVSQMRKQLTKIYDTINDIARDCERRGIDTSSWFYTEEEIEKMKQDPNYTFI